MLEMKISNCPWDMRSATAHTHPNGDISLSEQDRASLSRTDQEVMCINAGELATEPGTNLDNLLCYEDNDDGEPEPIGVQIEPDAETTDGLNPLRK